VNLPKRIRPSTIASNLGAAGPRTASSELFELTSEYVRGVGFAHEFTGIIYPICDETLHDSIITRRSRENRTLFIAD
jgi:hypothetical protein